MRKKPFLRKYRQLRIWLTAIFSFGLLFVIAVYTVLLHFTGLFAWGKFERSLVRLAPPGSGSGGYPFPFQLGVMNGGKASNYGDRSLAGADNEEQTEDSAVMMVRTNLAEFTSVVRDRVLFFDFLVWSLGTLLGYFFIGLLLAPVARAAKEQEEFLANASHELKTPITTIKTELALLHEEKEVSLAVNESLKVISKENTNLQNLVDKLLLTSSSKSQVKETVELTDLARERCGVMNKIYQTRKIKFTTSGLRQLIVISDGDKIREIITLLLDNAGKYANPKSTVSLSLTRDKKMVWLVVTNQGVGIPLADQADIFERFYRVPDLRVTDQVGSGLGLAIARSLAKELGGDLRLTDGSPQNTAFTLTLALK